MGIYSDDKFGCEEDSYCQMKCITNPFDNPVARLVIDYFITHSSQYAFAYIISNGHSPQIRRNGELLVRMCRMRVTFFQK